MSEEENDVEVPEDKDALIAQLKANQKWLMLKFDLLHDMLCPDKTGTWQQRVEQVCSACIAVKERGGLDIRATLEKNMAEDIKKDDWMPEGELLEVPTNHEMGKCPKCGGNLDYGCGEPSDDSQYFYHWKCTECHATGKEWYKMTFIEHTVNE